jgi:hypothetical protein
VISYDDAFKGRWDVPGFASQGIFLSYRREDTAPYARLLQRDLTERFPDARVFMDLDSVEAGVDFAEAIKEAVDSCAVLVALIGRQWATLVDEKGQRRLDNPDDLVRFEVQTALERGVRVIPVLVDGARPFRQQDLPSKLHKFARLNALELSYGRLQYDVDRLLDQVQRVLATTSSTGIMRDSLQSQLERLQDQLADIEGGVNRLESHAAETADSVRRVLRVVGSEITDCPRLFTLTLEKPPVTNRLRFHQQRFRLILWCEHPGHWHPWPPASYSFNQSKGWLASIGPYAILVFRALQLTVPIAASVAGIVLPDEQSKLAQNQLDLMKTLVVELPYRKVEDHGELAATGSELRLTPAEGQAVRAIRVLLYEHDPQRMFGGLRRELTPSGEFVWVCSDHYPEYGR